MESKYSLRELLYKGEHESCTKYVPQSQLGFKHHKGRGNCTYTEECVEEHTLMFLIKGEMRVSRNAGRLHTVKAGQITLFGKSETIFLKTVSDVELVTYTFNAPESGCDKLALESLTTYLPTDLPDLVTLDLCQPFDLFLQEMIYCLDSRVFCHHYHELKGQELLMLFRFFYSKRELASLFNPVIGKDIDFKDFVLKNYKKVSQVNDLIELSNMSKSVFFTKFKEVFGMTAKQWMVKQTNERICNLLAQPGIKVKDIMFKMNFNSPSYFSRYCVQQFGCKPTQLISKYAHQPHND